MDQVSQILSIIREVGCRCVLDEPKGVVHKPGQLVCSNSLDHLSVVEPVELNIECRSDGDHVDINRVRMC